MGKDRQMELLTEADELLTKLEDVEERCKSSAAEVVNCREALKAAKELYDGAVAEMRGLARVRREVHPLFDAATVAVEDDSEADPSSNGDAEAFQKRALTAKIRQMKHDEPKWTQEGLAETMKVSRRFVREALAAK